MTETATDNIEQALASMTIKQWCKAENISPATFFKLRRLGLGPCTFNPPGTSLVRIVESRESYHARMAQLSETQAAKQEHQRRAELASAAGKAAARSAAHWSKRRQRTPD